LAGPQRPDTGGSVSFSTRTRTLAGMQKEALVECIPSGTCWRLLCDEGPWLNGTDLAPFPLGYFAAGLGSCFMSDIHAQAAYQGLRLDGLTLGLDIYFSMEGSILKGTMAAGVDSINLTVNGRQDFDDAELEALATSALRHRSLANRALQAALPSRFCLRVNGQPVAWPGNRSQTLDEAADPAPVFALLQPPRSIEHPEAIIRKDDATTVAGAEGAVGLQSDQKRSVHIHADAHARPDGLAEIAVQCLQPAGSRFIFLSEDAMRAGGEARAPCGLTYLSAAVAFCFMTQLGRYAQIKKLRLHNYRIVQKTSFGNGPGPVLPVETAVFLDSDDTVENNLRMVVMGEQTCYLHTTFRQPVDLGITVGRY